MDVLNGTSGNDTLNVSAAGSAYELQGLGGADTLTGSAYGDLIVGGTGADVMFGNAGDDTFLITGTESAVDSVNGGDGSDEVLGGSGDDTFRFLSFSGASTVERIDGGLGTNIVAGSATSGSTLNLSGTTLVNIARIVGGSGMDTITGSLGDDTIVGGSGKDTMYGNDGDDTFIITGTDSGSSFDSVSGGNGFDQILGGDGDDTFRFYSYSGSGTVERIDGGTGTNIIAAAATSGSTINLSGTVLVNISEIVGGSSIDKLTGSAGDDRIRGAGGNDTLVGGLGEDTAVYSGNFDAYSLTSLGGGLWRVATTTAGDGSDTVSGFETLEFANGRYSFASGTFTPNGPVNTLPVALGDTYGGSEDQALTVLAAAGVLANDSDADGNVLTVSAYNASSAQGGAVVMNPDGSFTYTPVANFNGSDSFGYTVSDGQGGNAVATVTINVAAVADAPVAGNDAYGTAQDTPLVIAAATGVLANDGDVDGGPLTVSAYDATSAQGGAVVMNPDGSFTYTPVAGYNGNDSFAYTVSDGALTSSASVTVTVYAPNTLPVALGDTYGGSEDQALTVLAAAGVLANDSDADGNVLTVSAYNATSAQGGAVVMNPDGSFTYTPVANFNGSDSFGYTVSDGQGGNAVATVTINVAAVADAPVAGNDAYGTAQDTPLVIAAATGVLANDGDVDGGPLTVSAYDATSAQGGTVVMNPDGSFTYTPVAGYSGSDSFAYTVSDGALGTSAIVTITVASAMTLLTGTAGVDTLNVSAAGSAYELQGLGGADTLTGSAYGDLIVGGTGADVMFGNAGDDTFLITGTESAVDSVNGGDGSDEVLGGSGDDTFRFLSFSGASTVERIDGGLGTNIVAGSATSGSTLNLSGTTLVNIARIVGGSGMDTITGSLGDDTIVGGSGKDTMYGNDGDDTFIITGTDSGSSFDSVSGGNGFDQILGGDGDDTFRFYSYSGSGTVERIDGGTGTNIIAAAATSGSTINLSGTVLVNISEIVGGSSIDKLTGSAGDDRIRGAGGNDTLVGGLGEDTAVYSGNFDAYSLTSLGGGLWRVATTTAGDGSDTVSGFETLEFANGRYSFASGTFTPNGPVNTLPVALGDTYGGSEDQALTVLAAAGVLANDSDADGNVLTVSAYNASSAQGGAVVMNPDGSFTYTPVANFNGSDSFGYTVSDGQGGNAVATVTINVAAVADAPVAGNDAYGTAQDTPLVIAAATGVLANDGDVDGGPLTVSAYDATSAQGGAVVMNPDGSFTYTPVAGYNGNDSFAYTVSDGALTSSASVTVTVYAPNTLPVALGDTYGGSEDQALTVLAAAGVLANDSDADGNVLTVSAYNATSAQGGAVVMNPDGSFTYTPVANFNGSDSFGYTVSDGQGGNAVATVTINVAAVADAPVAGNDAYGTAQDTPLVIAAATGVLANDGDVDGGPLTVSAYDATSAQGGTVVMNPDGSFTYTPVAGYSGSDSFAYTVSDGALGTSAIVTITVASAMTLLTGTAGVDTLNVSAAGSAYELQGLGGADTLTGSAYGDLIVGGTGADVMFGNAGDDTFLITGTESAVDSVNGGDGSDEVLGGSGDDTFRFLSFSGASTVERIDGGLGTNIVAGSATSGSTLNLSGTTLVNIARIVGGSGMDTITGSLGDDTIVGGSGKDTMYGNDGDDTFIITGTDSGSSYDSVHGGRGYDRVQGGDGNDTFRFYSYTGSNIVERIDGGGGVNIIAGAATSGSTINLSATVLVNIGEIVGGSSIDKLTGSAGDDRIRGAGGNDTLAGGLGEDTALYSGNFDAYSLTSLGGGLWRVTTTTAGDGSDTVSGFETLEFANGSYSLASGTFTPTGSAANHAPSVAADNYDAVEDQLLGILAAAGVLANDSDADGNALTVTGFNAVSDRGGTVSMAADGSFTYLAPANLHGIDSFYYTVSDGQGSSRTGTVSLNILPVADAPVVVANLYNATRDTTLVIDQARTGVLANDSDPDADALTVSGYTAVSAQGGSVLMSPNGTFSYRPAAGFSGIDTFSYTASDGALGTAATVTIDVGQHPPMTAFQSIIANLGEGEWARVNANNFSEVWTPVAQRPAEWVTGSPASIILAWSAATWDVHRDEYIIWGGGHANYEGNEVYTWSANTLRWERASLPSAVELVSGDQYETVDGYLNSPISSHNYDSIEFLEVADRMITFGGAAAHTGSVFITTSGTRTGPYLWDPSKADPNAVGGLAGSQVNPALFPNVTGGEMWENRDTWGTISTGTATDQTSDYVKVNGKDVVYVTGSLGLFSYTINDVNNPALDVWERVGRINDPFSGAGAGAYDPEHNIYVRTSGTRFTFWDLDGYTTGNPVGNVTFMPGDPTGEFSLNPKFGMEYDPVREQFVLWDGDATVWLLRTTDNVSASSWTITKATPGDLTAPTVPSAFTGVLGKWDYIAEDDVFIGLTDSQSGDIWVYKPEDWTPQAGWLL